MARKKIHLDLDEFEGTGLFVEYTTALDESSSYEAFIELRNDSIYEDNSGPGGIHFSGGINDFPQAGKEMRNAFKRGRKHIYTFKQFGDEEYVVVDVSFYRDDCWWGKVCSIKLVSKNSLDMAHHF